MAGADGFGARLRSFREKHGLTQEQLAEKAGVSRVTIARWETDSSEPSLSHLLLLARALGVTLNELVPLGG